MFLGLETFLIPLCKTVLHLMRLVIVVSLEDLIHITSTTSGKSIIQLNLGTTCKITLCVRWKPFDIARNVPDLGPRFSAGEKNAYANLRKEKIKAARLAQQTRLAGGAQAGAQAGGDVLEDSDAIEDDDFRVEGDTTDLDWSTVIKRTFEAYIRGERPNMYGEWLVW
jgi:hypothetical protein